MSRAKRLERVTARVVFDSRGDKTVEVEVTVDGHTARAGAPSGKSRGKREVVPFPEGGPEAAVRLVRERFAGLLGRELDGLLAMDALLAEIDRTPDLSAIGGNTAIALSVAAATAYAASEGKRLHEALAHLTGETPALPLPLSNVLGGGAHAGPGAPEIQEFLLIPLGARTMKEAIEVNVIAYRRLGRLLQRELPGFPLGKGDEGGYAPPIGNRKALELVRAAADEASDETGVEVGVGLDVAGSNVYDPKSGKYALRSEGLYLTGQEFRDYLAAIADEFGLVYIEDPFSEDSPELYAELQRDLKSVLVCGDDLVVTRAELISEMARRGAIRAAIVKPNQVGTLTLTLEAVKACASNGAVAVASHRSGETTDAYISQVAVGTGCKVIKCGLIGGERVAKLNELLRTEEEVGEGRIRRLRP
ncbi:MAG: phosphopyruvate hydratase [Thaumarchaeota archaeon]|nr:phosphopyruvate hydratase [Candidatus Calditenuaceae archaeon]MDW8042768.1 enolase C-terminal domain-like protein [Nitrososphaerota archaeon]